MREVNKMTRSMRYSRDTKMVGETSVSARKKEQRGKMETQSERGREMDAVKF